MASPFGLTAKELRVLMEARSHEALERYEELGKAAGLSSKLKSNVITGLSGDAEDIAARHTHFGVNFIPPKKSKGFFALALDACQDPTLIILIICAVVSVALATFNYVKETMSDENKIKPTCFPNQLQASSHQQGEKSFVEEYAEFIEGFAIMVAILTVIFVTAYNDYSKEKQFRGLQDKISEEQTAAVLRQGEIETIGVAELVVGDIVQVKYGDLLPADGMVIASNDLKIDESALTGESDHVKKSIDSDPALLSGTHVMEGSGKMIVTAVGPNSQSGIIFTLLGANEETKQEQPKVTDIEKSPLNNPNDIEMQESQAASVNNVEFEEEESRSILQAKLDKLTIQIGYMGMFFAIATILVLIIRLIITISAANTFTKVKVGNVTTYTYSNCEPTATYNCTQAVSGEDQPVEPSDDYIEVFSKCSGEYMTRVLGFFIIGVTVLVVAVPEGLPLAVTISLAYSVKKMMDDNNLVRHLDACETMGNATAICSDKTGTLTTNRMTVVQSFVAGKFYKECQPTPESLPKLTQEVLVTGISINSNYTSKILPPAQEGGEPQQIGNKTECALLGFVLGMQREYKKIRETIQED